MNFIFANTVAMLVRSDSGFRMQPAIMTRTKGLLAHIGSNLSIQSRQFSWSVCPRAYPSSLMGILAERRKE